MEQCYVIQIKQEHTPQCCDMKVIQSVKHPAPTIPKGCPLKAFGGSDLTWSNLQKKIGHKN